MVDINELEKIAYEVHEDMFHKIGPNLCLVSEPHQAFMIIDIEGNIRFMWGVQ